MLGVGGVRPQLGQLGPGRAPSAEAVGASKSTDAAEVSAVPVVRARDDLAQHAEQLAAQLVGRREPVGRVGGAALGDQLVERVVLREQRRRLRRRQRVQVGALVAAELHAQHDQRAADRVDVGGHARPDLGDLGRLVADGAVDRGLLVVDAAHAAEVDQLDRVADLDQVVGLEVAVDEAEVVQVLERGQHLERRSASAWSTGSGS